MRQHYFGEVIALRHQAGHGTSLSNAIMPVGQVLTDLPLSQMESVRFAHNLAGRIGTRKEISVQGQICAQGASWLPRKKKSAPGSLICEGGGLEACLRGWVIKTGGPPDLTKHLLSASLEAKPSAFLSHPRLLSFFILVSEIRANLVAFFWQKLAHYA
ncbi:MAG TPA: hypothetical protein VFS12_00740, partial [Terriglobia bacterium]|nr:hypothetical protein [Terriglobia bacterium]